MSGERDEVNGGANTARRRRERRQRSWRRYGGHPPLRPEGGGWYVQSSTWTEDGQGRGVLRDVQR